MESVEHKKNIFYHKHFSFTDKNVFSVCYLLRIIVQMSVSRKYKLIETEKKTLILVKITFLSLLFFPVGARHSSVVSFNYAVSDFLKTHVPVTKWVI